MLMKNEGQHADGPGNTLVDPNWELTEEERKVYLVLEDIAEEVGVDSITAGKRISRNRMLHRVG
jgi:hypothetical protein